MDIRTIQREIKDEYIKAKAKYNRPFASHHEAYAVILEELDELWDEIKKKEINYDLKAQRKEAMQVGAMILRFINELT